MTHRLLIVQPYIPAYRVNLFTQLEERLSAFGVELRVAAPTPKGADRARRDHVPLGALQIQVNSKSLGIGSKTLNRRSLRTAILRFDPHFVIVEQAIKNLENWEILAGPRNRSHRQVAMWGHGRTYSTHETAIARQAKNWLTNRSDWFFSYTKEGVTAVTRLGFNPNRITVLRNSIDTQMLRRDLESVTQDTLTAFRAEHDLVPGRTALFLGGLDSRKGIPFLLRSAVLVAEMLPEFKLIVAGSGDMESTVSKAAMLNRAIVPVGRVDGHRKALMLRAADALLIPEWVGLVAVDSLVAGVPIMTTTHCSHSPEFDYLSPGSTCFISPHNEIEYARAVVRQLVDEKQLSTIAKRCKVESWNYSIENMAENFANGIRTWKDMATGM
jgi:glycosyltransferase involved in cell wall biosynthesis